MSAAFHLRITSSGTDRRQVKNIQVDRDRILETQIQSELLANRNVSAIFIGREAVLSYDYFV